MYVHDDNMRLTSTFSLFPQSKEAGIKTLVALDDQGGTPT
jgi:hypothetical protein